MFLCKNVGRTFICCYHPILIYLLCYDHFDGFFFNSFKKVKVVKKNEKRLPMYALLYHVLPNCLLIHILKLTRVCIILIRPCLINFAYWNTSTEPVFLPWIVNSCKPINVPVLPIPALKHIVHYNVSFNLLSVFMAGGGDI